MCGICGIIHLDGSKVDPERIRLMSSFLHKRGPDAYGVWHSDLVSLGHTRLSIVDLSEKANQPMVDESSNLAITFNGEIYNYKELRIQLQSAGIRLKTESDTEVLLKGYLCWGLEGLLKKIDGMYAFILHDHKLRTTFAVRDHFGKKPLYYYSDSREVLLSSDIRSIKVLKSNLQLNFKALDYYLTELTVPQPLTIYEGVKQVMPGHYLQFKIENEPIEIKYWKLEIPEKIACSTEEALLQTEFLLNNSISKRMTGDVPIGCFLSGGADSGLIVALLAKQQDKAVKTFTVGFKYADQNEIPEAKKLASRYGTNHTEIIINSDISEDLEKIMQCSGEPFADSSIIPSYYICKAIGSHVKVALSGDGGDEVFGGYHEYGWAYQTDEFLLQYTNQFHRQIALPINKLLYQLNLSAVNHGLSDHYNRLKPHERLFRGMGFTTNQKIALYKFPKLKEQTNFSNNFLDQIWKNNESTSYTNTLFLSSFETRLLNDYLVKVDRSSMANSLEVRCPFLDEDLIRFSLSLPNEIKLKNGRPKYLLKQLAKKYIDPDFERRPKKGFSIPLNYWIRKELKTYFSDILFSGSLERRGLFQMDFVRTIFNQHIEGSHDHTNKIWALANLEIWLSQSDQNGLL